MVADAVAGGTEQIAQPFRPAAAVNAARKARAERLSGRMARGTRPVSAQQAHTMRTGKDPRPSSALPARIQTARGPRQPAFAGASARSSFSSAAIHIASAFSSAPRSSAYLRFQTSSSPTRSSP